MSCVPHLQWQILDFANFEDVVWVLSLRVGLWLVRAGAERTVESLHAFALMGEASAAAEMAATTAALPGYLAMQHGSAQPLAALAWAWGRIVLRGRRGPRWGQSASPAGLCAALAAGEVTWEKAAWRLWAQLVGAWLGVWYMQWVSIPREEWGFCMPQPRGKWPWAWAAALEGAGACVQELRRRALRPSDACALKFPPWLSVTVSAVALAIVGAAAAPLTGALFNPAVALAGLHACARPHASPPLPHFVFAYVVGPCLGAVAAVAIAPALRCVVQDYLHIHYPLPLRCYHPQRALGS